MGNFTQIRSTHDCNEPLRSSTTSSKNKAALHRSRCKSFQNKQNVYKEKRFGPHQEISYGFSRYLGDMITTSALHYRDCDRKGIFTL